MEDRPVTASTQPGASGGSFTSGLVRGLAAGVVVALLAVSSAAIFWSRHRIAGAKRGWNMVALVVAARHLSAGHTVAPGDLAVKSLPEQLAGSAATAAELPGLTGKTLRAALAPGDVVVRGNLEELPAPQACWLAALVAVGRARAQEKPEGQALLEAVARAHGPNPFAPPAAAGESEAGR